MLEKRRRKCKSVCLCFLCERELKEIWFPVFKIRWVAKVTYSRHFIQITLGVTGLTFGETLFLCPWHLDVDSFSFLLDTQSTSRVFILDFWTWVGFRSMQIRLVYFLYTAAQTFQVMFWVRKEQDTGLSTQKTTADRCNLFHNKSPNGSFPSEMLHLVAAGNRTLQCWFPAFECRGRAF